MRPKTLAHDWCADASCETCSHRHKSESQPMRPKPAVGQVWEDSAGMFMIVKEDGGDRLDAVYYDGITVHGINLSLIKFNTYIGQFAGFKVQEETT